MGKASGLETLDCVQKLKQQASDWSAKTAEMRDLRTSRSKLNCVICSFELLLQQKCRVCGLETSNWAQKLKQHVGDWSTQTRSMRIRAKRDIKRIIILFWITPMGIVIPVKPSFLACSNTKSRPEHASPYQKILDIFKKYLGFSENKLKFVFRKALLGWKFVILSAFFILCG